MKPDDPQLRQQLLLIRSTELRHQLRGSLDSLQRPAAWIDKARVHLTWLGQHPIWPAAGLALLLLLKPRRVIAWSGRLWWLWKTARQLQRWRASVLN
ncbi:MAG: YqjK family protein [Rhodoferax sp.]|jgi:hypothetical protein